ncbi:helix-turn-helix domain-containing protein [Rhizobium sp. OAE497]|uniref:helix-turn-helix domain-containing protein n=1 Tax=Rhizobium sp. OAE497 TaxID=2663796 RepID=UPI0018F4ABF8
MVSFHEWLAAKRAEALERGGKPLTGLPAQGRDLDITFPTSRRAGEIVNPLTGEIVTGCLVITKLAAVLGITSDKLTDQLESLGVVQRVLKTSEVPMITAPHLTKPRYHHSPEATCYGVAEGYIIPIGVWFKGVPIECLLITPEGQKLCREQGNKPLAKPLSKVEQRRALVADMLAKGLRQAEIARAASLPRQTVSRIAHELQKTG